MATQISADEQRYAAVCYWGSMALWLAPAFLMLLKNRDSSRFVRKHALQSICLNLAGFIVLLFTFIIGIILGELIDGMVFLVFLLLFVIILLGLLLYFLFLGICVFQGDDVDIPYLTELIETYLPA